MIWCVLCGLRCCNTCGWWLVWLPTRYRQWYGKVRHDMVWTMVWLLKRYRRWAECRKRCRTQPWLITSTDQMDNCSGRAEACATIASWINIMCMHMFWALCKCIQARLHADADAPMSLGSFNAILSFNRRNSWPYGELLQIQQQQQVFEISTQPTPRVHNSHHSQSG